MKKKLLISVLAASLLTAPVISTTQMQKPVQATTTKTKLSKARGYQVVATVLDRVQVLNKNNTMVPFDKGDSSMALKQGKKNINMQHRLAYGTYTAIANFKLGFLKPFTQNQTLKVAVILPKSNFAQANLEQNITIPAKDLIQIGNVKVKQGTKNATAHLEFKVRIGKKGLHLLSYRKD